MPTLFIFQTFLPSRRRDCHTTTPSKTALSLASHHHPCLLMNALPVSHPHYPSPRTKLASLVKGRWIDGTTQTVALLRFTCDTPAFFIHQTFCRQDGGIAAPPHPFSFSDTAANNPSKTALSLASHHHPCLLINALPVSQNVANRQHPCLPSKKGRWLDGIAQPLFHIIFIL